MKRIVMCVAALWCALSFAAPAAGQGTNVSGVVIETGTLRPLSGTYVVEEGTGQGTLTDAAGRFRLQGVRGEVALRFQRIESPACRSTAKWASRAAARES